MDAQISEAEHLDTEPVRVITASNMTIPSLRIFAKRFRIIRFDLIDNNRQDQTSIVLW